VDYESRSGTLTTFECGGGCVADVKESIENAIRYLTGHPEEARYTDSLALATLAEALCWRC
jgi:hypothetical protein